jgi:hypothetical protein
LYGAPLYVKKDKGGNIIMAETQNSPQKSGGGKVVFIILGVVAFLVIAVIIGGFFVWNMVIKPNLPVSTDGNDQITFKTKEGTFSAGAGLPADFPKDIPLYPKAKAEGHFAGIVTFSSQDTVQQIGSFFEAQMKAKGWTVEVADLGETMKTLNCAKGERKSSITINQTEGKTDILVGYLQK